MANLPPQGRTDVVAEAINTPLESSFGNANGIKHIIKSYTLQFQEIENEIYNVWVAFSIEYGEGFVLDILGRIIGAPRKGLSDLDYRAVLRATILLQRSHGRVEDIYAILKTADDKGYKIYTPSTMSMVIEATEAWGTISVDTILDLARRAKEAGCSLRFIYSNVPEDETLIFASGDIEEADTDRGLANDAGTVGGTLVGYEQ